MFQASSINTDIFPFSDLRLTISFLIQVDHDYLKKMAFCKELDAMVP